MSISPNPPDREPNSQPPRIVTTPPQRLSLQTKLAFGVGDMGSGIAGTLLVFSFLVFLTDVAHLRPGLASAVLAVGKIWDAINDPLVGILSDRTKSKWGRRHVWMLGAALPFGVLFMSHWIVPPLGDATNQMPLFWYYVAVSILFNTAFTAVNLPYAALAPQLATDYDDRTSLTGFRFAFSIGGSLASLALGLVLAQQVSNPNTQYFLLGTISAVVSIGAILLCVWGTTDPSAGEEANAAHDPETDAPQLSFWQELRYTFSNKPFRYVVGIYLCSWFAFQLTATTIPYFAMHYMKMPSYFTVALIVQAMAMIALFPWAKLVESIGRRGVYFVGSGLWILAQGGLFWLTPTDLPLFYLLCAIAGVGIATAYLIPWSMVTDVTDLAELETGLRNEGMFFSMMVLLQKFGLAFGLAIVGRVLEWVGFESTAPQQSDAVLWALRVLVGPFPAVILAIGVVLVYFYPITKEIHAEIVLKLSDRQRQ